MLRKPLCFEPFNFMQIDIRYENRYNCKYKLVEFKPS